MKKELHGSVQVPVRSGEEFCCPVFVYGKELGFLNVSDSNIPLKEGLLTAKDVANYLKLNIKTVYLLAKKNILPCVRIGRVVRFRSKDIAELTRSENLLSGFLSSLYSSSVALS